MKTNEFLVLFLLVPNAFLDWKERRIGRMSCRLFTVAGLVYRLFFCLATFDCFGIDTNGMKSVNHHWLVTMACVVLIGFGLFTVRAVGAGDVRLLMAIGLFLEAEALFEVIARAMFLAAGYLLTSSLISRILIIGMGRVKEDGEKKMKKDTDKEGLPFAVFLLIGYVIYLIKQAFGG